LADTFNTYYHSPVGLLEITGTKDYISGVHFCDAKPAENDRNGEPIPPMLINCTEQLIQYFNGERRNFELPINQGGSSFQRETWNLLMTIPFGKTISYIQLAIKTGDPKATRAVAGANGKNNVAIIVPCHRVIGSNRELVGYAGGLWRKKWLLDHERKYAYGVQTLF
jgi:methylated-DNA-[protein]-cysteine S-methyltransferase